jgi:colanic acid/amylovoran biosynthesis protein
MRVGLLGVQCDSTNMGVAALAYSAVRLIHEIVPAGTRIVLFSVNSSPAIDRMKETLQITDCPLTSAPLYRRRPKVLVESIRELSRCDAVVDFTGGDSFSDIYGMKRLVNKLTDKEMVLACGVPLVLAPQTIGPFRQSITMPWVRHVLEKACLVCTRDQLSCDFVAGISRREVLVATDVAVALPWNPDRYPLPPSPRPRIGLNVSGLLWNGGYSGRNQFGLRTDYRTYCRDVVAALTAGGVEVHLVPHVIACGESGASEDDRGAALALSAEYPGTVMAPAFDSPVEAKSYIAHMDILIGSRMHATIASFTSGVPTIPVAYSRKFAGFFRNLDYNVLVDLTSTPTRPAVDATLDFVRKADSLAPQVAAGNHLAQQRLTVFTDRLSSILSTPPDDRRAQ